MTLAVATLAFAVGSFAAILIVFSAFVKNLARRPGGSDDFFISNTGTAATSALTIIATAVALVATVVIGTLSHVASNWKFYLTAAVIGTTLAIATPHTSAILGGFDQFMTTFVFPVYDQLIIPVVNLVRIAYGIVIPWWNFFWQLTRLVISSIFITVYECAQLINGDQVVRSIIVFVETIFNVLSAFLADFEADLALSDVYAALANVTDPFTPFVNCFCQEASFAWNILNFYIHQENFQKSGGPTGFLVILPPSHDFINAILNFVRVILRFAATLIIDSLDGGSFDPFDCGTANYTCDTGNFTGVCNAYVNCQVNRPPAWNLAFDYACAFVEHWLGQFDDLIWCVVLLFLNAEADQVPRPFSILIGIGCFLVRFTQGAIDFIFKIDLVFDPNIKYASRINVTLEFVELGKTPTAIEAFFDSFQVTELHYVGCAIAEIARTLIGILRFLFEFGIAFASFDFDYLGQFLADYPYETEIRLHLEMSALCVEKAIDILNHEWAVAFKFLIICFARIVDVIILTLSRFNLLFGPNPENYFTFFRSAVIPRAIQVMDTVQRFCIALGNCVRTFDQFLVPVGMNEDCISALNDTTPALNRTAFIPDVSSHANLFCVTGDGIQTVTQFAASIIQILVHVLLGIVLLITAPSVAQFYQLLRIILDDIKLFLFECVRNGFQVVNGYLSTIGAFFGCQDLDGSFAAVSGQPTVGSKLKLFFLSFTNITNFVLNIIVLNGETFGLIVQCSTDVTSTPIFLQDPTGCETATFQGENIGPPAIASCSQDFFSSIIAVICRYLFEFWDHVFTWLPIMIVRLIDFILCLALPGSGQNNYFDTFFEVIFDIRCFICDIVRIVVAIIRALVYLFSGDGFQKAIDILTCFPPFNTIRAVVNTIQQAFANIDELFSGALNLSDLYDQIKAYQLYFCAPDRPPCGFDTSLGQTPLPGFDLTYSPYLPCYVTDTYLFKRQAEDPGSGYTALPLDGQALLFSNSLIWNISDPKYNFTQPQSPCYPHYRYVILTANVSDPLDSVYWARATHYVRMSRCAASSIFATHINGMLPLTREFPVPPEFVSDLFVMIDYLMNLGKHVYIAASYVSYRASAGGARFALWNAFKQRTGATDNFPLTLVSLWDQTLQSLSMYLSGIDGLALYTAPPSGGQKRQTLNRIQVDAHIKHFVTRNNITRRSLLDESLISQGYLPPDGKNSFMDVHDDDFRGGLFRENSYRTEWTKREVQDRERRKRDPRSLNGEPKFGDVMTDDISIGRTLGQVLHSGIRGWTAVEGMNSQLYRAHASGQMWKRRFVPDDLAPGVITMRKRDLESPEDGYTFEEVVEMKGRYNAYMIQTHATVLMDFTRDVFFRIGSIFLRAYNNTFKYNPDRSQAPFHMRRGIRNFIMSVRGHFDKHVRGIPAAGISAQEVEAQFVSRKRTLPVYDAIVLHRRNNTIDYKLSTRHLIALSQEVYVQQGPLGEWEIFRKRAEAVYEHLDYPPGGFVLGNQLFPLVDLCIPASRTSSDLPPPFGNIPLPGFCFNCSLALEMINQFVFYLGNALNDSRDSFLTLDPNQATDPHARRQSINPCNVGPAEPSTTPCCDNCDCHTGVCSGALAGSCSIDSVDCCGSCADIIQTCVLSLCSFTLAACTVSADCASVPQTCGGATLGQCGPAPEEVFDYPDFYTEGDDWTTIVFNLIWYIPGSLLKVTPTEAQDAIVHFFTVWDFEDTGSIGFWLSFLFQCRAIDSTHCDTARLQGVGIISAIWWTYGSLIITTIFLTYLEVPSTVLYILWYFSLVLTLSVAYFYQPICFPMLPLCLANDLFWYLNEANVPCIDWTPIFGSAVGSNCSLSVDQCYDPATQTYAPMIGDECPEGTIELGSNERNFPDCTGAPYNFDEPLKPLVFVLQIVIPDFTSWLRNTNSPTVRSLRDSYGIDTALNISGFQSDGLPEADQTACFVIASGASISSLLVYILIGVGISLVIIFLVQLITALVNFIISGIVAVTMPVVEFSTTVNTAGAGVSAARGVESTAREKRRPTLGGYVSETFSQRTEDIFRSLKLT